MDTTEKHYIAHIRNADGCEQTVNQHNDNVSVLAQQSGALYGIEKLSAFTGRHHDDGKDTTEYLEYIKAAAEGKNVVRGSVIHSTHGALLADQLVQSGDKFSRLTSEMVRTAIMSHHGLRDCISMDGVCSFSKAVERIAASYKNVKSAIFKQYGEEFITDEYKQACEDTKALQMAINEYKSYEKGFGSAHIYLAMYERLLLSILIDADRTDTACFEDNAALPEMPAKTVLIRMWQGYRTYCDSCIAKLQKNKIPSRLDEYRAEISASCSIYDCGTSGVLRLVLPCGAGKTLSALRYALHTAEEYGKRHIFYVAPFNSILEQNANEIAKYIGNDDAVLQHHSNIVFEQEDSEQEKRYQLLTENWSQSPIIATSAVQFLNTLFAAKTSCVRRMQALGNSVIIVDEIQALPINVLKLFNAAMNFLAHFCNSVIVLCSATQPLLDKLDTYRIMPPQSIIPDERKYRQAFKRVEIVDHSAGNGLSMAEAAEFILKQAQVSHSTLAVVNTKAAAREITELISKSIDRSDEYDVIHLSTNMCPAHRSKVISELRAHLNDSGYTKKIICISTTLIEAGVDVSFERVICSLTGLDRIVQAAGRCNRNKETTCGIVSVIYIRDEKIGLLGHLQEAQQVTREVFYNISTHPERYRGGALSQEAMDEYYTQFYFPLQKKEMAFPLKDDPEHTIIDLLTTNPTGSKRCAASKGCLLKQAFKEAGDAFSVIEDIGKQDVVVEYNGDAREHIEKLLSSHLISEQKKELRLLQQYSVQLSQYAIEKIGVGIRFEENARIWILNEKQYDKTYGVNDEP
jgi:CRISPR-associated endonuclease/helicase Cas3